MVTPFKKIILSNVHTYISNTLILEELQKIGLKSISSIYDLHIGLISDNTIKMTYSRTIQTYVINSKQIYNSQIQFWSQTKEIPTVFS